MVSPNNSLHWATKRLSPNQNADNNAKTAVMVSIGQKSRQDGAQPPVQERHPDHTQPPDQHQSQSQQQQNQHQQQSSGQVSGPGRHSTPAADTWATKSPQPGPGSRPHHQRQGAARGTRSSFKNETVSAFEWEALALEKTSEYSGPIFTAGIDKKSRLSTPDTMSRNRPRGPPLPRDNGLGANEETDMWNKILQDLRKAKEKNDKQKSLAGQIAALNEKMGKEAGSKFVLFFDLYAASLYSE